MAELSLATSQLSEAEDSVLHRLACGCSRGKGSDRHEDRQGAHAPSPDAVRDRARADAPPAPAASVVN